ncbi:MAG: 1-phosphofructokinase [Erysipelotrichaceae bacterium]|nr:1-phosphofructokinase [Erysipelotrichaceae bacterium]
MIYTVTFNPALDYVIAVDHFKIGLVNRVSEEHIVMGGKGINVAYILNQLGYEAKALGFVAGFTGEELVRGVREEYGITPDFIHVKEGMTRINVKLKSDEETEINGMGPKITEEDVEKLFAQLDQLQEGDVLVLSGSIPGCIRDDIYEVILKRLEDKGILFVVDATGDLLVNVLKYKPFLIKPNNHEIEEIFDVTLKGEEDIVTYAKKLQEMGARNVLVSLAGDGSLLVDENGETHRMGVCKGKVKNSVGAGDSMVAGFVAGYLKHGDFEEALALGTASGGATAFSVSLATRDFIYENLEKLLQQK